jgi:hypothetical protein
MALYNDPFSFASDADLMPVYQDPDFGPEFYDLFYNESDVLSDFPMDLRHIGSIDPIPAAVVPTALPVTAPMMINTVHPVTLTMTTTEDFNTFTNPTDHYEWEHPLPILKSDLPYVNVADSNVASNDESLELDSALSLSNEITHHFYYTHEPIAKNYNNNNFTPVKEDIPMKSKKHRLDEEDEETDMALDADVMDALDDDPTGGFKLPASKSPIMEAMVVCALNGWGIEIAKNNRPTSMMPADVVFKVTDFNRYYKISRAICSKQRPTDDLGSRIKSLRRWFVNFPKKKDRCENSFSLTVKPTIAKKVNEIIERNSRSLGLTKRRRRQ